MINMTKKEEEMIEILLTTANKAYVKGLTARKLKSIIENDIDPEEAGLAVIADFFNDTPYKFIIEIAELMDVPIQKFYKYYNKYKTIKLKNGYNFVVFCNKNFEKYMEDMEEVDKK